jgi:Putative restriction endonuclease
MVGTSKAHNRIAINLTAALNTHLRGGPCQVFMADVKVYVKNATAFYYPDVVVACDRGDGDPYVVTKLLLIGEVLSPSTERIDREEKLHNYRQVDSLEEYVLITPETKEAEVHRRVEGLWKVEAYVGEGIYTAIPGHGRNLHSTRVLIFAFRMILAKNDVSTCLTLNLAGNCWNIDDNCSALSRLSSSARNSSRSSSLGMLAARSLRACSCS